MTVVKLKSAPQIPTWVAPSSSRRTCAAQTCAPGVCSDRGRRAGLAQGQRVGTQCCWMLAPFHLRLHWGSRGVIARASPAGVPRPYSQSRRGARIVRSSLGCRMDAGGDSTTKCLATAQSETKEFRRRAPSIPPFPGLGPFLALAAPPDSR